MHIYGIYILGVILMTSSFCLTRKPYGRHVFNYLPPKIKFCAFRLNWKTQCKKALIAIDYNGHNVKIALTQYTLF